MTRYIRSRDQREKEARAVLLADKTIPCPNEVRFLLTHDEQF
jgi:hypothetical protein